MSIQHRRFTLPPALVAVVVHAASAQRPHDVAAVDIRPGSFRVQDSALAVEIEHVGVPANRGSGSASELRLAFVRFSSTSASPGPPIIFLAGGPGDAATRAFRGMPLQYLNRLRAIGDVIAFDQRGTGLSEPHDVSCPPGTPQPREQAGDPTSLLTSLRADLAACIAMKEQQGLDVQGLTTAESADDVAALAGALGASKVSLLAGSYGTHLALAVVRRHPDLVSRMVLAGVEGPDDTFKLPLRVDSVLARIAMALRPGLAAELESLKTRLDEEPARFSFPGANQILLDPWDLQRWVAGSLGDRRDIAGFVSAVPAMLAGDYSALARWTLRQRFPAPVNLMHVAMDCASGASAERLARIHREAGEAILGDAINFPIAGLCDLPGLPHLPDSFRAPLESDVPALLIAGTFDGRTPVANAEEVSHGMPNAVVLVIDKASHGLMGEPEAMSRTLKFLADGK